MVAESPLKTLGQKIAFSTLVQYLGKGTQMVLTYFVIKLISNFFAAADYGIYGKITEYALFFSTLANLGIFANVVRKMSEAPHDGKLFINALFLRIFSALVFFITAVLALFIFGKDPVFIFGVTIFLGTLFFDYITSVCDGMLQANYLMGRATIALTLGKLLQFGIIFYLVKISGLVPDLTLIPLVLAATVLSSVFTAGLSLFFVSRKIKLVFELDKNFMWTILKTSIVFGLINIVNNLYFRFLPDYFASRVLDDAGFASFNIAFHISQVLSLASTFLVFSFLPGFKQYIENKHFEKARKVYRTITQILLVLALLLFFGGVFLGPHVIAFVTHEKYVLTELGFLLPLMLILAGVSYFYDLILITIFAFEKELWQLKREALALVVALLFFFASLLFADSQTRLLLIFIGAILAEALMVILGGLKVRKLLS